MVKMASTGHGFDNNQSAAEFKPIDYFVKIDGIQTHTQYNWDAIVEKTLFIHKEELGFMIEQIGVLGKEHKLLIMKLLLTSLQEIH